MGLGVSVTDESKLEIIQEGHYIRWSVRHGDASPGTTSLSFPAYQLPAYITALRSLAAQLGFPLKASYDGDFISSVLNHEGIGRPVTPAQVPAVIVPLQKRSA